MENLLKDFGSSDLDKIKSLKLMNRKDTKFIFHKDLLFEMLNEISDDYDILEIEKKRIFKYTTLYYDTPFFHLYKDHHNKKLNRFKVRMRKYDDSNIYFLEIKFKTNTGHTVKKRIEREEIENNLTENSLAYVKNVFEGFAAGRCHEITTLEPKIYTNYSRITLSGKNIKEKVTLDLNYSVIGNQNRAFNSHVIAELKQEKLNTNSPFYGILRNRGIKKTSFSKYCAAIAITTNEKQNQFKYVLNNFLKIAD